MTAAAADFDGDGWTDIYVASDSTAAILYHNNRDGTFRDVALESGTAFSENGMPQAGMGLAVGDVSGDGRLDVLKTHFADDVPALYRSVGARPVRGRGHGDRRRRREPVSSSGAPACRTSTTTAGLTSFYVTGNVYPEIEARLPAYPHRGPRVDLPQPRRHLRGRLARERPRRDDAPLEPWRGVRRLRQRRRPRRARHEHE